MTMRDSHTRSVREFRKFGSQMIDKADNGST